jgi:hypothetical protein
LELEPFVPEGYGGDDSGMNVNVIDPAVASEAVNKVRHSTPPRVSSIKGKRIPFSFGR